ncbi:Spx/MgsR family RNA polymerase-binding regulatory protein [Methylophilaceae bacterium]|mgnify:FL=1|nr:Spx/MgsR family RNA polymerase-binding regulatory protein [Methylophilaceae bacterium]
MLQVYGIKNCNTVKKSLNWLSDHNFEYEFFDVKKNVLSKHLINDWISKMKSNYTWINLINKSGITWKQLSDEIKNGILTSDDAISIILNKPTIMKRPVITKKGKLIAIGFDENLYEEEIK